MGDVEEPEYTPSEYVPKHSPPANEDEQSKDFERKAPVMMTSWKEQQNSLRRMHAGDEPSRSLGRNPSSNMLTRERLTRNASHAGDPRQLPSRGISRTASRQLPARGVSRTSSRHVPSRGISRGVSRSTSRRLPAREISRTSSRIAGGEATEDDGDLEAMAMALQQTGQTTRFDLSSLQESNILQES